MPFVPDTFDTPDQNQHGRIEHKRRHPRAAPEIITSTREVISFSPYRTSPFDRYKAQRQILASMMRPPRR
jgi:hypothetical protein